MKIIVELPHDNYTVKVPSRGTTEVEDFMYAIETAVMRSGYSEKAIEEYVLEWALEIKEKRDGKG